MLMKRQTHLRFVQKYTNQRMILNITIPQVKLIKNWEGKVQKFGQDELNEYKTCLSYISFLPATPKYIKDNVITIRPATKVNLILSQISLFLW